MKFDSLKAEEPSTFSILMPSFFPPGLPTAYPCDLDFFLFAVSPSWLARFGDVQTLANFTTRPRDCPEDLIVITSDPVVAMARLTRRQKELICSVISSSGLRMQTPSRWTDTPRDGDCFFTSIHLGLKKLGKAEVEGESPEAVKEAVRLLRKEFGMRVLDLGWREYYEQVYCAQEDVEEKSVEEYKRVMEVNGGTAASWGGFFEANMLSEAFWISIDVEVWAFGRKLNTVSFPDSHRRDGGLITLRYLDYNHFQVDLTKLESVVFREDRLYDVP